MMPGQARVVQQSTPTGELASSPHNARPNLIKNVFDLDDKIKDDISRAIKDSNSPFVTTPPARCRPVKRVPEEADGTFETSPFHLSAAKRRRLFGQDDLKKDNLRSDLRNTDEVDVYQKQQVPVVPAAVKSILDYAQQSGFPAQEVRIIYYTMTAILITIDLSVNRNLSTLFLSRCGKTRGTSYFHMLWRELRKRSIWWMKSPDSTTGKIVWA